MRRVQLRLTVACMGAMVVGAVVLVVGAVRKAVELGSAASKPPERCAPASGGPAAPEAPRVAALTDGRIVVENPPEAVRSWWTWVPDGLHLRWVTATPAGALTEHDQVFSVRAAGQTRFGAWPRREPVWETRDVGSPRPIEPGPPPRRVIGAGDEVVHPGVGGNDPRADEYPGYRVKYVDPSGWMLVEDLGDPGWHRAERVSNFRLRKSPPKEK